MFDLFILNLFLYTLVQMWGVNRVCVYIHYILSSEISRQGNSKKQHFIQ